MSRRHWMHITAPVGTLIILGLMLVAVVLVAPSERDHPDGSISTEKRAEQHESGTAPEQEVPIEVVLAPDPVGTGSADSGDTQDATQDTEGDKQHAQADLEAQQRMALWAFWMVIVSAVSVVIAGIAVFLIFLTLREAKRTTTAAISANQAATKTVGAMHRSERAYVTMSHEAPGLDLITRMGHAAFEIKVQNHGRTPVTITDMLLQLDWFG